MRARDKRQTEACRYVTAKSKSRFLSPRPGAQTTGARKRRVALLRRAGCVRKDSDVGGGLMSDLKVRPPKEPWLRQVRPSEDGRYVTAKAKPKRLAPQ